MFLFLKILLVYSWKMQREAETQAEGEAGSLRGAQSWTQSQDPGLGSEPKADTQPLSHPGAPRVQMLNGLSPLQVTLKKAFSKCIYEMKNYLALLEMFQTCGIF